MRLLELRVPSYLVQLISCIGGDSPTVDIEQTHLPLLQSLPTKLPKVTLNSPTIGIGLLKLADFEFAHQS